MPLRSHFSEPLEFAAFLFGQHQPQLPAFEFGEDLLPLDDQSTAFGIELQIVTTSAEQLLDRHASHQRSLQLAAEFPTAAVDGLDLLIHDVQGALRFGHVSATGVAFVFPQSQHGFKAEHEASSHYATPSVLPAANRTNNCRVSRAPCCSWAS